jgi:hypothetical protein
MAATYEPIAAVTVNSAINSVLVMNSIPSTYTDLRLVIVGNTNNPSNPVFQFNGDTGANYSMTYVGADSSSASSGRRTGQNYAWTGYVAYMNSSSISMGTMDIMNYSNTTTYKTAIGRYNNAATGSDAIVNLWRSTSAISRIDILTGSSNTFSVGTTFTLYGIAAA